MSTPQSPKNPQTGAENVKPARVVVGSVSSFPGGKTDDDAKYKDDGDDLAIWTDYMIMNHYEKDGHRYMLGVSSPKGFQGDSVAFVQLASPTLLWICDWTACRMHKKPKIPSPVPKDSGWVVLDESHSDAMITVDADGTSEVYRVNGYYVYGRRSPSASLVDDTTFPVPPYLDSKFADGRAMKQTDLQQGLTDRLLGQQGNITK